MLVHAAGGQTHGQTHTLLNDGALQEDVLAQLAFLNRIDEILTFQQLTREQIADVVRLQMNKVKKMLADQGFDINVTDAAIDYLATEGYDPDFGARPVKRAIQRLVLNDLSRKILADEVSREKPITIDAADGKLAFNN